MSVEHGAREIVRFPRVKKMSGKSRTQIWRDMRAGLFPASVELGPNAVGWYLDEIIAWQESRRRRTQPVAGREVEGHAS